MSDTYKRIIKTVFSALVSILFVILYPTLRTLNKTEIDSSNTIISMNDFGCSTSIINESLLGKDNYKFKIGDAYSLKLSCDDHSSHWLNIMLYKWETNEIAEDFYKDKIKKTRYQFYNLKNNGLTHTVVPKYPYDKAIQYMSELNTNEWNIDEGYSILDIHDILPNESSLNYIVLIKDNQVMYIQYTDNLFADTNNIQVINHFLENSNNIFEHQEYK